MSLIEKIKEIPLYAKLLFFLFILKLILFNHLTEVKDKNILLICISLIYFISFSLIIHQISGRKKFFFTTYWIVSAIMFYDCLYFQYFNQLPSFRVIKQVKQVSSIMDSIRYLLKPVYFLFLIDLPLFRIYLKRTKKQSDAEVVPKKWNVRILSLSVLLLFTPYTIAYSINRDYVIKMSREEIFTYHVMDLVNNFLKKPGYRKYRIEELIAANEKRKSEYSSSKKHFGLAKDRNLIVIQVESLQNFPVNRLYEGQEITPNLNQLIQKDSIYFDNYYQQLGRGNTSDAEFVTNNSLYPAMDGVTYEMYVDNTYYGLPWILKERGYQTIAFHGYKGSFWNRENAYPNQGFDRFISEKDFTIHEPIGFGLNDKEFFEQSIPYLQEMQKPFYAFMVTLTNHHPYQLPEKHQQLKLRKEHEGTIFGDYLQSVRYTDEAIGMFIEELKRIGLYENSILAIYGDHHGIILKDEEGNKCVSEFLGKKYDYDEMMKVPLIIHIPGSNVTERNSILGGQIDFLPTMMNLMGIENNKSIQFGQDLNNAQEGFVAQQTYMWRGSFIAEDVILEISRDGIYKNSRAWNPKTGEKIDPKDCKKYHEKALDEIGQSDYILKKDLLPKIMQIQMEKVE